MKTVLTIMLLAVVSQPFAAMAEDEPPALMHNPFSRPSSEARLENNSIVVSDSESGAPALKATMVGPTGGLANVAGRILEPGDEIEGFVLLSVHEDYVIFRKADKLMTVYVKPKAADDDEQDD